MDLIAITTIHRTKKPGKDPAQPGGRKTPPEVDVISAGSSFTANKDEAEELIALGAAREDKSGSKKAPAKNTKSSSTAAAKQQQAKKDEGGSTDTGSKSDDDTGGMV